MGDDHEVCAEVTELRAHHNPYRDHAYVHHGGESNQPFGVSLTRANGPTSDGPQQGDRQIQDQHGVEEQGTEEEEAIGAQLKENTSQRYPGGDRGLHVSLGESHVDEIEGGLYHETESEGQAEVARPREVEPGEIGGQSKERQQ